MPDSTITVDAESVDQFVRRVDGLIDEQEGEQPELPQMPMTTCWRCEHETEMPFHACEGDTTVAMCDECFMDWLGGDFAILPAEDPDAHEVRTRQADMFGLPGFRDNGGN